MYSIGSRETNGNRCERSSTTGSCKGGVRSSQRRAEGMEIRVYGEVGRTVLSVAGVSDCGVLPEEDFTGVTVLASA